MNVSYSTFNRRFSGSIKSIYYNISHKNNVKSLKVPIYVCKYQEFGHKEPSLTEIFSDETYEELCFVVLPSLIGAITFDEKSLNKLLFSKKF